MFIRAQEYFRQLLKLCISDPEEEDKKNRRRKSKDDQLDSAAEKKKEKKKAPSKHSEDVEFYEDEDEVQAKVIEAGSESPRTLALRAMGAHAANVIDIMQKKDGYEGRRGSDSMSQLSMDLPAIREENSDFEHSGNHSIPAVVIDEVKPGDPPFPGAGLQDDKDEDEYKPKEKKKTQIANLMKKPEFGSQTSLSSIYSTDSADVYGQVPIRGEIQFGMKYDFAAGLFECHIFQARDVAAVDTRKEESDPYCKVYLLPDKTKAGKKKTKTRRRTLNPEWEEVVEFKISLRDLRTRTLWVAIWHLQRMGRNVFLGEVMIPMDTLIDHGNELESPTPKWYTLCEKGVPPITELYKGELHLSLMFEDRSLLVGKQKERLEREEQKSGKKKKNNKKPTSGKIFIHIKEGRDLPAADRDGFSDPFCKCYLLPMKSSKSKRKTPVIKHSRNAYWDYKTDYELDYEDLPEHGIEFTVWDWDRGTRNDFLGCARISLGSHTGSWDDSEGEEIRAWQHLIDNPNKWKDFVIPLRSKMDERPIR